MVHAYPCSYLGGVVLDSDAGIIPCRLRQDLVLVDFDPVRVRRAHSTIRRMRPSAGERNSAKVGELHERAAFFKVLDDPLRILLTERSR